jgi:hypothetical protein
LAGSGRLAGDSCSCDGSRPHRSIRHFGSVRARSVRITSWRKLLCPVIASTAVTTGLFVLGGVVVGGLVSGGATYALERRREHSGARIAIRLLEVELAIAAATADWAIEDRLWTPWNFERAHGAWNDYRAEAARVRSTDEWAKVSVAFYGIDVVELGYAKLPTGTKLNPAQVASLALTRGSLCEGANALRRRLGIDQIRPSGEPNA